MAATQAKKGAEAKEPEQPQNKGDEPDAEQNGHGEEIVLADSSQGAAITVPARLGFQAAQVNAIRKTVAKDCNDAELVMFLEVAARYNLDPFAKQIYAAKIKNAIAIIVSRDGLLAKAHEQPDFVRMDGDTVHKGDTFDVVFENGERKVKHSYSGFEERGDIVGAWARVVRKDHGETYFFAPFGEYAGENVWKKNPSAMILKCAEAMALRKAYSISGVVGEEEIERDRQNLVALPEGPDWGDDEDLAAILQERVERANELVPASYRPLKVRNLLEGADEKARLEFAEELAKFIQDNTPEEEPVQDAEVVD